MSQVVMLSYASPQFDCCEIPLNRSNYASKLDFENYYKIITFGSEIFF